MNPDIVVELGRRAIETTLLVSAPMLGLSLAVGLLVYFFYGRTHSRLAPIDPLRSVDRLEVDLQPPRSVARLPRPQTVHLVGERSVGQVVE